MNSKIFELTKLTSISTLSGEREYSAFANDQWGDWTLQPVTNGPVSSEATTSFLKAKWSMPQQTVSSGTNPSWYSTQASASRTVPDLLKAKKIYLETTLQASSSASNVANSDNWNNYWGIYLGWETTSTSTIGINNAGIYIRYTDTQEKLLSQSWKVPPNTSYAVIIVLDNMNRKLKVTFNGTEYSYNITKNLYNTSNSVIKFITDMRFGESLGVSSQNGVIWVSSSASLTMQAPGTIYVEY